MAKLPKDQRVQMAKNAAAGVKRMIWINNGSINKRIKPNEQVPEGWQSGRLYDAPESFTKSTGKTRWINNGIITKRSNLNQHPPEGWTYGRLKEALPIRFCACGCGNPVKKKNVKWSCGHSIRAAKQSPWKGRHHSEKTKLVLGRLAKEQAQPRDENGRFIS